MITAKAHMESVVIAYDINPANDTVLIVIILTFTKHLLCCVFQDYICPRCESGFIEELLEERGFVHFYCTILTKPKQLKICTCISLVYHRAAVLRDRVAFEMAILGLQLG